MVNLFWDGKDKSTEKLERLTSQKKKPFFQIERFESTIIANLIDSDSKSMEIQESSEIRENSWRNQKKLLKMI